MLFEPAPVSTVTAGPMLWPMERAGEILRAWDELIGAAPEELNGFFAFLTVPPDPSFPVELHMRKVCGVVWCHCGTPEQAAEALAPARALDPLLDGVGQVPFPGLQTAFDGLYPPGLQWYWKAEMLNGLTDELIDVHVEHGARLPTMHSSMHLYPIDGAVHRVPRDATAWAFRDQRYAGVIVGVDPSPDRAEAIRTWAREYWAAMHPFSAGGGYVNFLQGDEGDSRVRDTYGANYERLVQVKREYDPQNLFRVNQNIIP
jgi:hypothetical protein